MSSKIFELNTPVLFLIFNRLSTTQEVFELIRQAKPPKLYVASDGPRSDRDNELKEVEAVQKYVINNIDWDCEVKTLFREKNLGCRIAISTAIDWFFENEPEGIILEDDCLPHIDFFRFCEDLLDYYRHDQRIAVISGQNVQFGRQRSFDSYYFTRYNHCWGWATWKEKWSCFEPDMKSWPTVRDGNWLKDILGDYNAVKYWQRIFQATYEGKYDSWAYRWTFSCWIQNYLSIVSNVNLISNIGYGHKSTHTKSSKSPFSQIPTKSLTFPLKHPSFIVRDSLADKFTQNVLYMPSFNFMNRIENKFKNIFYFSLAK